jgi:P-type Ca2+ transporter type 2C
MREIRPSGLEGGEAKTSPTPIRSDIFLRVKFQIPSTKYQVSNNFQNSIIEIQNCIILALQELKRPFIQTILFGILGFVHWCFLFGNWNLVLIHICPNGAFQGFFKKLKYYRFLGVCNMRLSDFLDTKVVTINLKARNKTNALREMVEILMKARKIKYPDAILNALLEREASGTTGVGRGVAFPHARITRIKEPMALLAVSQRGVDFSSRDGEPVYLFFLFLTPAEETELHLQILSKALTIFTDTRLFRSLRDAKDTSGVLRLVLNYEKGGKETFFPLPVDDIYRELGTGPSGLSEREAGKRLASYGPNVLRETKRKSLFFKFTENLYNFFAVLLWAGGALAYVTGMPELAWAIFAVILINAVFSFWQEYKAEKALEALKKLLPRMAKVLRNGKEKEITVEGIVPGDIMVLEEGDSIPADARLIEAFNIRVDNSALTGESKPVYKTSGAIPEGQEFLWTELPNLVFAGTSMASGAGKAAVIATGMHTEIGHIAHLTQELKEEKSPLQREIVKVTKIVTILAVTMGITFFFLGTYIGKLSIAAAFIFAIGIIVANVPEGLLPTVTLSLAMGVQRMAKRNALIKKLSSVETLGSTTVICTDKTGTLTTSEMSITRIFINGKFINVSGTRYAPAGDFYYRGISLSREEMKKNGMYLFFDACVFCNNAGMRPPEREGERWGIIGDPTEAALLVMAAKGGIDVEERRKTCPRIGQLPFESVRKRMTSINLFDGEKPIAYVKGAPKEILNLCTHININGKVEPLTDPEREIIISRNDSMSNEGLRVLGIAYRPLDFSEGFTIENTEKDLIFLGLAGMADPPRPEVSKVINLCHRAGIRVVMITGDYGLTALSIAKKIGLAKAHNTKVVTGLELSKMDDETLKKLLKEEEVIFARVSPEHKMRIVTAFKDMDEVVAVTGDGVNDAPALKKADIGVAMGIRGSDVAKEAADMILTDDNFASIVSAIEEGRTVFANIKKFVTYIFASNIPEIVPFIAFILFKIPLPLTVMQILAVDLGTDMVPALALGAEPPGKGIMDKPPRSKNKMLLNIPLLLRAYCFLGPMEAVACMAGFFFIYYQYGWRPGMEMPDSGVVYTTATTMTLAGIVATQIANVFACRTDRESIFRVGFFSNRLVLLGIASELIIVFALVYTPFLQRIFGLAPLSLGEWGFLFAFTPIFFFMAEGRKLIMRKLQGYG